MKIVVAIGGSILLKEYDCKKFQEYSDILKDLSSEHELFVVVGGGKPARDYIGVVRDLGAGEAQCDDIGIEVTRINAKLLLTALGDAAYQRVPHNFQEALEFSASGKIIVMGRNTDRPRLVSNRPRNRLSNPPSCIRRKLEPFIRVKLFHILPHSLFVICIFNCTMFKY